MSRLTMTTVSLLLAMVAAAGCGEDQVAPVPPPVLRVEVHTWGDDEDLDGYLVVVDGDAGRPIPPNGELRIDDLEPGLHLVELTGAEPNCVTAPREIRPVRLSEADTVSVSFEVSCMVVGVSVQLARTGLDPDPSLVLLVDGVAHPTPLKATGVTELRRLSPGGHRFQLHDVAPNCTVADPAVRTATLAAGVVTPIEFSMACVAAYGDLLVTVSTDGLDPDPSGYAVFVDGQAKGSVGAKGSTVINGLAPGSHTVRLEAVDRNCQVAGENSRTVNVVAGRSVRDTVSTSYAVSCTRLWDLAFSRGGRIRLATMDGRTSVELHDGGQPAWSPDGRRLAYTCGQICVTGLDGSGTTRLETGDLVDLGSWSPDGTRLVFKSYNCDDYWYNYGCTLNGLFTIRADGTGMTRIPLPTDVSWIAAPDWSPDGALIAFGCSTSGAPNGICVTAPSGVGFRLLSQPDKSASSPSWSPDGSRIAIGHWGENGPEIWIMNADGTGAVSTGTRGWEPAWTPDGSRIVFAAMQCSGGACDSAGLASIKPDGSGRIQISTERNVQTPAVRP